MKKTLAAFGVAAMLLAGCSSTTNNDTTTDDSVTTEEGTTGADTTTNDATVTADDGTTTTASVTKDADGKVTAITIDATTEDGTSKKEMGDDYDMGSDKGSWATQVEYLENYILANGVDSVTLTEDGKAESEDVLSGCTINLTDIMEAVKEADAK